jgi:internalin A
MTPKNLLERIEQAKRDGVTELDLSDEGITELPPVIGQLTQLTWLDVSGNELSSLPPEIGQLTRLE